MIPNSVIAKLVMIGFKRWTKNGYDRLYASATMLGLDVRYFKSESISEAWFDGKKITKHEAYRLLATRTYIDVRTGLIHGDNDLLVERVEDIMMKLGVSV